ncbi:hydrolase [Intrasporangium chromatireducens Q5-1]|uniref:Hydrolase n=1 Tax=Intrasporangium chromatireducens Q5-1 TaxID=584657 RepID=W9GE07_9MICO|nr:MULTISPECIES: MBL fold metallo-hydrolase [Actinomycetes]EWT04315.1 hydrolase [Intrasporangium chromatireducens Q5-1]
MGQFDLIPVVDEGLGNSTYLLDVGGGRALVMDPERDLRQVRAEAQRRGLRIAWAIETHMHADFISGVRELAAVEGAGVLAPEVGPRGFEVHGLSDGDTVPVGSFALQALHTPGHSPEHLSYLLWDGDRIAGVFTGGSLMVGTAGRTDLVSPDQTVPLARAQFHSLQRLMELPDETPVWPTHGAGSFCSASSGDQRVSTIGRERATNPLLQVAGEEEFVDALVGSMGTFPDYFLRLGEVNEAGPVILGETPALTALGAEEVRTAIAEGAQVVDVRAAADYAAGHVPGSLSITLRSVFSTWLGWLADPTRPVIVVRNHDQRVEDIVWGAANVGFDALAGELAGGLPAWQAAGQPAATGRMARGDELVADDTVLDVRQAPEFAAAHVPGAVNIELGALTERLEEVPGGPVLVMCGHGERAMGAASILERAGRTDVRVLDGGPEDWVAATGRQLQVP